MFVGQFVLRISAPRFDRSWVNQGTKTVTYSGRRDEVIRHRKSGESTFTKLDELGRSPPDRCFVKLVETFPATMTPISTKWVVHEFQVALFGSPACKRVRFQSQLGRLRHAFGGNESLVRTTRIINRKKKKRVFERALVLTRSHRRQPAIGSVRRT